MIYAEATPAGKAGDYTLATQGEWLIGAAQSGPGENPEVAGRRLYEGLLAATRGYSLGRIWNYVPFINETDDHGLENYRAFCRGRAEAFEQALGSDYASGLPSASGVGTNGDRLSIVFAACKQSPIHFENPLQVAAYHYPSEHGPRAPSFARATRVGADVFISGTAAVRGHESAFPGDTAAQLDCTLENLASIGRECGLSEGLGAGCSDARHLKIYLRHALDFAAVSQRLSGWLHPHDQVHYLLSDICREELNVEIEISVLGLRSG